jgi:hypothetical protein
MFPSPAQAGILDEKREQLMAELSSFNPLIGILMKTIGLKSLCIGCHCEPPESGPIPHTDCHVTTFLAMTVLFASSRGRRPWRSMPSEVMDCFTAFAMTTFFRINLSPL